MVCRPLLDAVRGTVAHVGFSISSVDAYRVSLAGALQTHAAQPSLCGFTK